MSKTVLIIDDSVTVRMFVSNLLATDGYCVEQADNGVEGVEKAGESHYDLIISDINMPTMNGYSAVTTIRQDPTNQGVPIIVMSTASKDIDATKAYAAGANLYLTKPVKPDLLLERVRMILGDQR